MCFRTSHLLHSLLSILLVTSEVMCSASTNISSVSVAFFFGKTCMALVIAFSKLSVVLKLVISGDFAWFAGVAM